MFIFIQILRLNLGKDCHYYCILSTCFMFSLVKNPQCSIEYAELLMRNHLVQKFRKSSLCGSASANPISKLTQFA
jgi:hypothetical protein